MSADVSVVLDGHVPGQGRAVAEDGAVSHLRVVRDVDVSHQQVVVADARYHAPAFGAAVDGDELADLVPLADPGLRRLTLVFQVLRRHAHRAVRIKDVVFTDPRGTFDIHASYQPRAGADLDLRADDRVRTDLGRFGDDCAGIDNGCRVDGHYSGLS